MCRFLWEEEETALEKKLRASNYTEELVLRLWCLLEHIKLNKKMEGYPPWVSEATSNIIFSLLNASVLVKIRIFSVFCKEFSSLQSLLEDRRCLVFTMSYPVKLSIYAIFAINDENQIFSFEKIMTN